MANSRYEGLVVMAMLGMAFISIFNKPIAGLLGLGFLNLLDEAILLLCILLISGLVIFSSRIKSIHLLVGIFFLYSLGISLLFGLNRDVFDITVQSLINLKFFILILAFVAFFNPRSHSLRYFFNLVLLIALLGFAFNLLLGPTFNAFFDLPVSVRSNQTLRYGGFLNPNQMAFLMALYIGMVMNRTKWSTGNLSRIDWIKIFASLVVIWLTDSRSAIIGVLFFFVGFYWEFILKKAKIFFSFLLILVVSVVSLLVFSNIVQTLIINLEGSFDLDSYYIRGIIINMATQISWLYFPIGTGAASFGSLLSDGSPVYELFGVEERSFFVEKRGIYDSSIASILGEYGVIGVLFFSLMFYRLKRFLLGYSVSGKVGMLNSLFYAFLFYSFTNPTFTNNIYILLSIPVFMDFIKPKVSKKTMAVPQNSS